MVSLPRRRALQLLAMGAALGGSSALGGCRSAEASGVLLSARGELPAAWLKTLPAPWRFRPFDTPAALLAAAEGPGRGTEALLLSLGDGWAGQLDAEQLHPFEAPALLGRLAPWAQAPSRLFRPEGAPALAYPWAFGTWLLLLRNRPDLRRRQAEGWSLLLDPSLRRRLVLPSSPRLVIALACRQLGLATDAAALVDPRLPAQLRRLVGQAVALDERDGLNLLLAGDAEAAVLPSHRVIPLLLRDPRLEAVLPAGGSPLWWQLLLRPLSSSPLAADPPLPLEWLRDGLELPMLDRLLAGGWVPPLPAEALAPALARWPERLRPLLLPPAAVLARCTSLDPWDAATRQGWQQLWDGALAGGD
jgi:hypothetical protein